MRRSSQHIGSHRIKASQWSGDNQLLQPHFAKTQATMKLQVDAKRRDVGYQEGDNLD